MRLSFHYEPEFHIDLRPVASMTAICAERTAGVDVNRTLRMATLDVVVGGFESPGRGAGIFRIGRNVAG